MNIVVFVYITSWLLLTVFYLWALWVKKENLLDTLDNVRFVCLILILFAPIVVFFVPFAAYKGIKEERQLQEKNKRSAPKLSEKEKLKEQKINIFRKASSENIIYVSNSMIELAKSALTLARDGRCADFTNVFINVHTPKGSGFYIKPCNPQSWNEKSELCLWGRNYPITNIVFPNIQVDDCFEGAWQVFILFSLWHSLPLFQHAIYQERFYLFSSDDKTNIKLENKQHADILSSVDNYDTRPQIIRNDKSYFISCCYWTNWGGLKREYLEVVIENNRILSIEKITTETLIAYDCGVFY